MEYLSDHQELRKKLKPKYTYGMNRKFDFIGYQGNSIINWYSIMDGNLQISS